MVNRNSGYIGQRIDTKKSSIAGAYGINEIFDAYNSRVSDTWPYVKRVFVGLSAVTLNETDNRVLTVSVTARGYADGTQLSWTLQPVSGNLDTSDFVSGFIGVFNLSGSESLATGSFQIIVKKDAVPDGVDQFRVQIRDGGTSTSPIVQTSNVVTIQDTHTMATDFEIFSETTGPNSTVTGGWTASTAGGTTSPIMSIQSNRIGLRAPYWCDGDAITNNNIDFSGAVSMTVTWESSGVSPAYYYASINWPTSAGEAGYSLGSPSFANIAKNTVVIPISNGVNGKLRLRVTNSDGGFVYLYSVVLNY